MFFIAEQPVKFAHEIAEIAFYAAVVLHVLSNWRTFRGYFTRGRAVSIVVTAWLIGTSLVVASVVTDNGEAEQQITDRIGNTPITTLAPVIGKDVETLVDQLRTDGYNIEDPGASAHQLADQIGADVDDILLSIFR